MTSYVNDPLIKSKSIRGFIVKKGSRTKFGMTNSSWLWSSLKREKETVGGLQERDQTCQRIKLTTVYPVGDNCLSVIKI